MGCGSSKAPVSPPRPAVIAPPPAPVPPPPKSPTPPPPPPAKEKTPPPGKIQSLVVEVKESSKLDRPLSKSQVLPQKSTTAAAAPSKAISQFDSCSQASQIHSTFSMGSSVSQTAPGSSVQTGRSMVVPSSFAGGGSTYSNLGESSEASYIVSALSENPSNVNGKSQIRSTMSSNVSTAPSKLVSQVSSNAQSKATSAIDKESSSIAKESSAIDKKASSTTTSRAGRSTIASRASESNIASANSNAGKGSSIASRVNDSKIANANSKLAQSAIGSKVSSVVNESKASSRTSIKASSRIEKVDKSTIASRTASSTIAKESSAIGKDGSTTVSQSKPGAGSMITSGVSDSKISNTNSKAEKVSKLSVIGSKAASVINRESSSINPKNEGSSSTTVNKNNKIKIISSSISKDNVPTSKTSKQN